MDTVRFTQMKDGGVEDYQFLDTQERAFAAQTADRGPRADGAGGFGAFHVRLPGIPA